MHLFIENMERFRFCTRCLLFSFAACLLASDSNLIKVPQRPGAAGVFLLMEGGRYTLDLAAARAACLALNVTVASRAQMERAVRLGLQTCKFGWIAEQIAVVPRLTADSKCGNGNTGVVTWFAKADRKFGVFCFNASDLEETPDRSTASPQSSTRTWTPSRPSLRSATESPPPRKPGTRKAPEPTSFTSASTLRIQTTHSARVSSTSPTRTPPSAHAPTSISQLAKSEATVVSLVFSTSAHASGFSLSSESAMPQSTGSAKPPLGNVPTALIVLGVIFLLLTAAGVVWYYKLNIFTFRSQEPQKDDIETEMWKHTDSEADLHSQHEGGEEEEDDEDDRKYSSDITLCVNPDFKTSSSE